MNATESGMKLRAMEFGKVYPLYIQKAARKGRSKDERTRRDHRRKVK